MMTATKKMSMTEINDKCGHGAANLMIYALSNLIVIYGLRRTRKQGFGRFAQINRPKTFSGSWQSQFLCSVELKSHPLVEPATHPLITVRSHRIPAHIRDQEWQAETMHLAARKVALTAPGAEVVRFEPLH